MNKETATILAKSKDHMVSAAYLNMCGTMMGAKPDVGSWLTWSVLLASFTEEQRVNVLITCSATAIWPVYEAIDETKPSSLTFTKLVWLVNVNDTFMPAADCEELTTEEFLDFSEYVAKDHDLKHTRIDVWVTKNRKYLPMPRTVKAIKEAGLWEDEFDTYPYPYKDWDDE